jgi:hypothetical protein
MVRIQRRTVADTFNEGPAGAFAGAAGLRDAGDAATTKRMRAVENRNSTILV